MLYQLSYARAARILAVPGPRADSVRSLIGSSPRVVPGLARRSLSESAGPAPSTGRPEACRRRLEELPSQMTHRHGLFGTGKTLCTFTGAPAGSFESR